MLRPTIISLAEELNSEGVDVRVIVGKDSLKATKKYAKHYPFPVQLDPAGKFFDENKSKGVPFFVVSNNDGDTLKTLYGGAPNVSVMRSELRL